MTKPTSVEAAHPPRHGFAVDVAVLLGRAPVFRLLLMVYTDLESQQRKSRSDQKPQNLLPELMAVFVHLKEKTIKKGGLLIHN